MEHQRTLAVTITVDTKEEMFTVETLEGESGLTSTFGPTPYWSKWFDSLKNYLGDEVDSWIGIMMDEEDG